MANVISLTIEGMPEEDGHIRLADFLRELQLLASSLNKLDSSMAGEKTPLSTYRVVGLSHGSLANVTLEARPLKKGADVQEAVLNRFFEIISHVAREGSVPPDMLDAEERGLDQAFLEDVRALARPVGKTLSKATVTSNGRVIQLGPQLVVQIERALAPEQSSPGAIRGKLEWLNVHESANTFHIYPDVGPSKVACRFSSDLRDAVLSGVDRFVEVRGVLQYRARASYAHAMYVQEIEVFPEEETLPNLSELWGIAPDLTGGLPIGEFLESRDAEG